MRKPGRPKTPDLLRSPGTARVRFDGIFEDARGARRRFDRLARNSVACADVDLCGALGFSSAAWGAIAAGVRTLARAGCDVTVYANVSFRRLLALTVLPRPVRVIWNTLPRAA